MIDVAVLLATISRKLSGVSGTVKITAELPSGEKALVPYAFVAESLAKILLPHGWRNGVSLKVVIGIEQILVVIIVELRPSQLESSRENWLSACLIIIDSSIRELPCSLIKGQVTST